MEDIPQTLRRSELFTLLPVGKGLGFWEQHGDPQPIHTEAIQFNVLFIDKVEAGVVGKGGLGRERGCSGSASSAGMVL